MNGKIAESTQKKNATAGKNRSNPWPRHGSQGPHEQSYQWVPLQATVNGLKWYSSQNGLIPTFLLIVTNHVRAPHKPKLLPMIPYFCYMFAC